MKNIDRLVTQLGNKCGEKHYSLVTVESCTGGGLAYVISKNPDASSMLERSYVVYSNAAKESMLDISVSQLQLHGLVSKHIAKLMAEQGLKKSRAQISIAMTGVEQEDAHTPGIVWIACAGIDKTPLIKQFKVRGSRKVFCETTIAMALKLLLQFIK